MIKTGDKKSLTMMTSLKSLTFTEVGSKPVIEVILVEDLVKFVLALTMRVQNRIVIKSTFFFIVQ
jgi:hypothetical protein